MLKSEWNFTDGSLAESEMMMKISAGKVEEGLGLLGGGEKRD